MNYEIAEYRPWPDLSVYRRKNNVENNDIGYVHPEYLRQDISQLAHEALTTKTSERLDGRKSQTDYVFVTVNLQEDRYPADKFFDLVSRYVKLVIVDSYRYVFEQRGETPTDFHGIHSHIFFKRQRKPSEVLKETKRFFTCCVGNPNAINVKYISKEDYDKVCNYIEGKKADPSKHLKQENDRLFRQTFGLDSIYAGP